MLKYGCIGETLKHSFSAEIHAMLSDEPYELCEVAREDLNGFMERREFCGINVTIPYKQDVIPHLSRIDPCASQIGAVNTIVNRAGDLYGYNTDFYGLCELFNHLGADLNGKKVAILGTGGTSLTALAVAESLGASEYFRVSRSGKDGAITYEALLRDHRDTQIIINTTPCGMYPHPEGIPVDPAGFSDLECVADAVYNPLRTRLISEARARGIPAEGGLFMLVAQAVRASEIFLDRVYPADTTEKIWKKLVNRKENIVLIGMPGSGKTSVGKLLAERFGRPFIDADELLTSREGRTPAEILREDGEAVFRDLESGVVREDLSMRTGCVIATGGGVILRPENIAMLRRNGRICFLDRPWQNLVATGDRPLSATPELLKKRYEERHEGYLAAADMVVPDLGSAEQEAERIGKDFEEG